MGKITQLQVWIIGIVLAVISAVLIFFLLIKPANEAKAAADQRFATAETVAVTKPQKEKQLKEAKAATIQAQRDWDRYDRQLMPDIPLTNLYFGMRALWKEQLKVLGPKVDKFLRADKSVQVVQANIQLSPPPTDPNAVNVKSYVYDLGTVTVMGTFENITRHVERWNKFDRLVLADGLTLQGNSPRLFGTYTLRAFVFPHGTAGPTIPQASGGAGGGFGGGMGGFGGGRGMGGESGPPMGMGSSGPMMGAPAAPDGPPSGAPGGAPIQ